MVPEFSCFSIFFTWVIECMNMNGFQSVQVTKYLIFPDLYWLLSVFMTFIRSVLVIQLMLMAVSRSIHMIKCVFSTFFFHTFHVFPRCALVFNEHVAIFSDLYRLCGDTVKEAEGYNLHNSFSQSLLEDHFSSSQLSEHQLIHVSLTASGWLSG